MRTWARVLRCPIASSRVEVGARWRCAKCFMFSRLGMRSEQIDIILLASFRDVLRSYDFFLLRLIDY